MSLNIFCILTREVIVGLLRDYFARRLYITFAVHYVLFCVQLAVPFCLTLLLQSRGPFVRLFVLQLQCYVLGSMERVTDCLVYAVGIPRLPGSSSAAEQAGKTRIFMIKSSDIANIHTSIRLGVWATGKKNTRLLEQAFQTNQHVILLFSGNETGGFQGYARMVTPTISGLYSNIWGNFSVRLGNNFRVHWLKQCKVEFEKFGSLVNPLNAHQSIRKSRDCQVIAYSLSFCRYSY